MPVHLPWADQPAAPGMVRAELSWQGPPGSTAQITSALAAWGRLRFETTEDASPGCDAVRYSYTPSLGLYSAVTLANGDIAIPESRLRAAMTVASAAAAGAVRRRAPGSAGASGGAGEGAEQPASLGDELARLLGEPWDDELEPFRCAADGAPVRWLHATG